MRSSPATTRGPKLGPHRLADRYRQNERHRALRLPEGHPRSPRQRPPSKPHRRPHALGLQASVKLSRPRGGRIAYESPDAHARAARGPRELPRRAGQHNVGEPSPVAGDARALTPPGRQTKTDRRFVRPPRIVLSPPFDASESPKPAHCQAFCTPCQLRRNCAKSIR